MLYLLATLVAIIIIYLGYGKYRFELKENFTDNKKIIYVRAWSLHSAVRKVESTTGYTPIVKRVWLPRFLIKD
ncbi:TPA: hypothetical protein ACOQ31_005027 [Bacillus cereus]|uniref:hypothetical protein n=1 Tax=Bacillus cereus TaxID=1396 RepID=UPI001927D4C1|nr:hypothetical protein [Bacillus cereus]MBL3768519.1 hypothetical protein [Bacillus cereus]HDR8205115.1 hypothetical protein [Bacillus cereus]HDR8211036.1 hypothetical protein [Bacillus cereus]HDR8225183.1 hypothetical protein [Bacillus cereus]HDR8237673.1 hypothetical protein [Bacillus cereus]